jgi:CheY-like chemotaxis protein
VRTEILNPIRVVSEGEEDGSNRSNERVVVSTGKVGSADRAGEQRIADEQLLAGLALFSDLQTDAAGAMTGGVMGPRFVLTKRDHLPGRIEDVDWRLSLDGQPERGARLNDMLIQEKVVTMQIDRDAKSVFRGTDTGHMIDMRVRQENVANRQRVPPDKRQQSLDFVAGINQEALARLLAGDDEAVFEEWPNRLCLNPHAAYDNGRYNMILAVVDDLMFMSKIRSAATELGLTLAFARSSEAALAEMRQKGPSLVIFDLNNPRTDPMGTLAAMKSDQALASIPTVGYVSHVDADVVNAARTVGVDDVVARSTFSQRLREILSAYR